ncbi:3-hydroxybenzoate 6-hydroxylase 1 [Pleurostoma richardsiae]|uniref:3-hydroxybenzoate 6-hydroxylase 1 n=1 Tax=Pleurostoma richardsiae TaxID=41990 RepID=A0AA38RFS1_9PEZI|nr:3-hydroxybenzoate 6-hydroxylase 1 [Pleurostoma richardsiae]
MAAKSINDDPLRIVIAGAGIAGLTAAVGFRQQGHEVTIFEKSELAQETGAAIHLAPNCHGILRRLGVYPEKFGANPLNGIIEYDHLGELRLDIDLRESLKVWQHPWLLSHRVQLHNELKKAATEAAGEGRPAVLRTSSRIVDVDPSTATVTLSDGSKFSGDLVVGADGVGSAIRKAVAGDDIKPFGSGKSAFRFLIPRQKVSENPVTKKFAEREGFMTMWHGNDRRLVMYPCSNNTTMNFVAIHPSQITDQKEDVPSDDLSKNVTQLLDIYRDFGPAVNALLKLTDVNELKLWTLLDMKQLPSWTKEKVALAGDAAHPFLPYQGQGGGVAMEDAASLCALLPRGTPKNEVPERLALYEKIRMHRAHRIQEITRWAGADLHDENRKSFNIMEFHRYNFGHDEWHNTTFELKKWLWSRNGNVYWRQPVSFGPMTSPRQDHLGRAFASRDAKFVTHSVRFRTSATYLKTLLPSPQFSFSWPGSIAEATLRCTELDNLAWLGGGGYRFVGLWIHGVRYTKKDGSELFGSFLPVLFESLCDPITTGREEIGMPKLYCDIDLTSNEKSSRITCGWRGSTFLDIELLGLEEMAPEKLGNGERKSVGDGQSLSTAPQDHGLFVYRYVPAVGKKGIADAEYPVFINYGEAKTPQVVTKSLVASDSRIDIGGQDWEKLPTLHHIAGALAEMPVYEIIRATREEGRGVDELSHAQRIE